MNAQLALSPTQITIAGFLFFGLVMTVILIGRYFMNTKTHGLTEKYQGKEFNSPLIGRHKYPDVDVFNYSRSFFLFGLSFSTALVIIAFSLTTVEKDVFIPDDALSMEEDIEVTPPRSAEPPPPPPPPPPPAIAEVAAVDLDVEDDIEFMDQSVDAETATNEPVEAPVQEKEEVAPPPPPPPPPPAPEVAEIFQIVEEMPRFPGCEDIATKEEKYACASKKMLQFIYSNIEYPSMARENGVQGTVVVRFVVNEQGKLDNIELLRDIGASCGEEAIRVVKLMNEKYTWHPGKQRGRKVKVLMNLPVKFKLVT